MSIQRKSLLLLLTFFVSLTAVASDLDVKERARLIGKVTTKGAGQEQSLADITIRLEGTNFITFTNDDGTFLLENIPYGEYHLILSSILIDAKRVPLSIQAPEVRTTQVVEGSIITLDELVVTDKSRERKLIESGFPVQVIRMDEVGTQAISVVEVLDKVPGVRIQQTGGLGSRSHFNINGLSGTAIKIYIDGLPASAYGGGQSFSSLPTNMIERIEVYKGVVPAHLGSDALGGAINVVLKNQNYRQVSATYEGGSFNTHKATVSSNLHFGRYGQAQLSAYYNYSDNDYKVWGDEVRIVHPDFTTTPAGKVRRFNDSFEYYGARLSIGLHHHPLADRLTLGLTLNKGYKEVQHGASSMVNAYGERHNRRHTLLAELNYKKRDLLVEGLDAGLHFAYSAQERMAVDTASYRYNWDGKRILRHDGTPLIDHTKGESSTQKFLQKDRIHSITGRANLSYQFLKQHTIGIDYFLDWYKRDGKDLMRPLLYQKTQDGYLLSKHLLSLSYQWSTLNDRLKFNAFGKYYFGYVGYLQRRLKEGTEEVLQKLATKRHDEWGIGLTSSYHVLPEVTLVASAEKTLRIPAPNEIFGSIGDNILTNKELLPEESYNFNIGVRTEDLLPTPRHDLMVDANLFYRDTKNMIREQIRPGDEDYVRFENLENVLSRGGDIELTYTYDASLTLRGSFSLSSVIFNTEYNSRGERYGFYKMQIRNEPRIRSGAAISYVFRDLFAEGNQLTLYSDVRYTEAFRRDWGNVGGHNLQIIPAQYPINIGITYKLKQQKVTLSVDAKNILDQQVYDHFGLQKPGFAIYGKVSYSLF